MNLAALILVGGLIAAEVMILFRGIILISQSPLFHFPIVFLLLTLETLIIFLHYKNILSIFKIKKPLKLAILSITLYLPIFAILLVYERTSLGLSFSSELPWYALTAYPLIIFFPLNLSLATLFKEIFQKHNPLTPLLGMLIYFLLDVLFLWKFEPVYIALCATFLGFLILGLIAIEAKPKIKYILISLTIILIVFSKLPYRINMSIKSFVREYKTEFVNNIITPYGELYIHKKKNKYMFSINHNRIFKYPDTQNLQEVVHIPMLQYPWAESILVIGEWREIIDEIMRYPNVSNIYWMSPVPDVFENAKDITKWEFSDPDKLRILSSDPRAFIKKIRKEKIFDIVFISLPDPTNTFFNRFYTKEFFNEIRSVISDSSMLSITIKTGEEDLSRNHRLLSSSVYQTLSGIYPNTLETYGFKSQIMASHNRNFSTSHLALAEFLNVLKDIPVHISPSLIKYKLNSRNRVLKELSADHISINSDTKPASLKYSFNEMLFTFGAISYPLIKILDTADPLVVYIFIVIFTLITLKLLHKNTLEAKLKAILFCSGFVYSLFLFNTIVSIQSGTGQIFRFSSLFFFSTALGGILAIHFLRRRSPRVYISALRILLFLSGLFLIMLPVVYELSLSIPQIAYISIFLLIGGFLFAGIKYLGINSYLNIDSQKDPILLLKPIVFGFLAACLLSSFVIPVMGVIDILPAIGIFCLGCVTLVSI